MSEQNPRPVPELPGDAEFSLGGNCPVQGEGSWKGLELYFRARGSAWSFSGESGEDGQGVQAWGPAGNAGWLDHGDAFERVALHLWAWHAAEHAAGAQKDLVKALLAVDPEGVEKALGEGADAGAPAMPGGPTPLAMALGLFSSESEREGDGEDLAWASRVARVSPSSEKVEASSWARMMRSHAALQDDGRDERRLACAKSLLAAGADPNASAPGWAMSPLDWAAALPSGEEGDEMFDDGGEAARLARQEAIEKRPSRLALNPCFALIQAGADPWAHAPWQPEAWLLDSLVNARAMGLAQALARTMGERARWEVAWGWMSRCAREEFYESRPDRKRPAKEAVERGFFSGEWEASWVERARERFAQSSGGLSDKAQKVLALAEGALLSKAAERARVARGQRL